jgi:hypothetical protein
VVPKVPSTPNAALHRQGPNRQDFVCSEGLNVGLPNGHHGDRLPERVEHLQHATRLAAFRMRDGVDQDCYVTPPKVVFWEVTLEGDTLIERQAHGIFSFEGFKVTK